MKTTKKTKLSTPKPDNQPQLHWDYLLRRVDNLLAITAEQELRINKFADIIELQTDKTNMKTPKKTKPSTKPADNQLTLDWACERLVDLSACVKRLDERINAVVKDQAYTKTPTPVEPNRPTLKWYEQEPAKLSWLLHVDPATLVLNPGTTLRYNVGGVISTFDGVPIGQVHNEDYEWIHNEVSKGAKVHVYLTNSRKLGIKLGRPA